MRRAILFTAILLAVTAIKIDTAYVNDPIDCIKQKCPTQWAACEKDPKCAPALQECEKKCGTSKSCWTLCLPSKGSQAAVDTAKCAAANGCNGAPIEPVNALVNFGTPIECIESKCRDQLRTCQKDAKCFPALQDCQKECVNDTACYSNCLAKKGNANATSLWGCIIKNDCLNQVSTAIAVADPQQCIEEKCPTQWAACQKDSKCIPALQDCEKKCGTKQSCWEFCLPGKGSSAAVDVAKCAASNKCLGSVSKTALALSTPDECIMKYCKTEEEACVNDRRCVGTLDFCDNRCNTNLTCWNDCVNRSKDQNAQNYFACIIKNDCLNKLEESTAVALADPQQCIEEKCPTQWAACQKDSKCAPALQECEKKCGSKESCWKLCLPTKGSQAAIDVAKCAAANGCNGAPIESVNQVSTAVAVADPQQCIEEKCPTQWAACQKDSKCIPALQDCEKKCGTSKSCWTLCLPSKGSQAAIDTAKCADANKCLGQIPQPVKVTAIALADPQQCIEEKCPTQWAACQKDSKCIPALQDCEKKCGTSKSCWTLCLPSKGSQAAIDTAKCADANKCLGFVPGFETCIYKSCQPHHDSCLSNLACRHSLIKCRVAEGLYNFDLECLTAEAKENSFLNEWFTCAGEHFCL